jgi:hypothetical protein
VKGVFVPAARFFLPGVPIEFKSVGEKGSRVVHAKYVRRIDDLYSLVDDLTGYPPRLIRTARLQHAVSGFAPEPLVA